MVAAMFAFIWLLRDTYPLASLAIVGFVVASHAWNHEAWSDLGFRLKGAWRPFREFAAYLGVLVALLLVGGVVFDSFRAMPLAAGALGLLLYCAWGLCQQYLLNGFFVNRVARIAEGRVAALAGACAFSLVHLPNWFLMAVCLVGGLGLGDLLSDASQPVVPGSVPRSARIPVVPGGAGQRHTPVVCRAELLHLAGS